MPRINEPRIPPYQPADWDEETKSLMGDRQTANSPAANITMTVANHPVLASRWLTFAGHVLGRTNTLPPREREILILRTGWRCQSEYEFGQHTRIGMNAGLTEDEIKRITQGPDAGWSEGDALLIRAADELHDDSFISNATWAALSQTWGTRQMMDLVFTVGQYTLVSMALNSFGVQLDEGVATFPE